MALLVQPILQYTKDDGTPLAFARAYFYLAGTTTPADVYADADLEEPHTVPVEADDAGRFPPIYFEGTELLRMKLIGPDGDLMNPELDVDPVNELFTVFADNLADNAIEEKLGYTPVNPAEAVFTGNARQSFTPSELNEDDIGFRGNPRRILNVDHVLGVEDSQYLLVKDDTGSYTWTIPADTFPIGHYFEVYVGNVGTLNLVRDTGVVLRGATSSVDEDKELLPYYKGRIQQVASNEWVVNPTPTPEADLSLNGFFQMPNGYIRQWGRAGTAMAGGDDVAVVFPLEFPNGLLGIVATPYDPSGTVAEITQLVVKVRGDAGATFTLLGAGTESISDFMWEAWGY